MQTSDERKLSPSSVVFARRLLFAVVLLTLLVLADIGLTLLLEPYGSNAETVWYEYRQCAGEKIDTLVVGTSVSQNGVNPEPLRETLTANAINLSSPCQSLESSYHAITRATSDHPEIQRVLLGTSYSELESAERMAYAATFTQALTYDQPILQKALAYGRLATNETVGRKMSSVAMVTPFLLSHVDYTPSAIAGNVNNRLTCENPIEARTLIEPSWIDLGHGFANYTGVVNLETLPSYELIDEFKAGDALNEHEMKWLAKICDYCAEKNIDLVVFCPPQPAYQTLCLGDLYPTNMSAAEELVEEHDGVFLDFSLYDPALYAPHEDEFGDAIHLNADGAYRFSEVLAQTIDDLEGGENVQTRFFSYDEWSRYLDTVEGVTFTHFSATQQTNGVLLEARAYAQPAFEVEYEYALLDEATGTWVVERDWSNDPAFLLQKQGYGTVQVRLSARLAGSDQAPRVHYQTVTLLQP